MGSLGVDISRGLGANIDLVSLRILNWENIISIALSSPCNMQGHNRVIEQESCMHCYLFVSNHISI